MHFFWTKFEFLHIYDDAFVHASIRIIKKKNISCLVQFLNPSKAILVASKVKTSNFNMFGSASQNQFLSPKAILVEAIIPIF